MDAIYWFGAACFICGAVVGLILYWAGTERNEKYVKRMIDHAAVHLDTCLNHMMNARIRQEESLLHDDQNWRIECQQEAREFNNQQIRKYETLREEEKKQEVKEIYYNLPLPPETLMTNFCPEDHMLELRKGIRDHKLNYDTLLPWFRVALMAGYSHGKNIAIINSKKKVKK